LKHVVPGRAGKTYKVRSRLEVTLGSILNNIGTDWEYEVTNIKYKIPESNHTYKVDFTLGNGTLIEGKGYLSDHAERTKYILLKEQHPDLDLKFVFANPNKKCGGMKMTHGEWATKHKFDWCAISDHEKIKEWCVKENN